MRSPVEGGRRTWGLAHSAAQHASRRVPLYYRVLFANAAVVVLGYLYYDSQRNTVRIQLPGVKIELGNL